MEKLDLFVTPIWKFKLLGIDNSRLVSHAYSLYEADAERRYPTAYIQVDDTSNMKWRSFYLTPAQIKSVSELDKLVNIATENANKCFLELNPKKDSSLHLKECWYNINGPDEVVSPHLHPGTTLVMTYYIKIPNKSGNIVFQSGDNSRLWNFPPKYFTERNKYTDVLFQVPAEDSLLVAFPGNLMHYVQRNVSGEDRLCLTLNFSIKDVTTFSPNHKKFNR